MMKRRIDYRLMSLLLAVLILGTGGAFLVHDAQMRRQARTLMAKARRAEAEGRIADAIRDFQRYLVFAPDDNAARAHCAEIMEQLAGSDHEQWRVVEMYEQVLYRDPSRQDIRRRLATLAFRLGWTSEARAHLEILLREQPNQGDLENLLGQCQEDTQEYAQAAATYEAAIRDDPDQLEAYIRLASLYQYRLDQAEAAARIFDTMVKNNSQSPTAYLGRALQRMNAGLLEESERDMVHARQLAPHDPSILLAVAELERRRGRMEQARSVLQQAREREPGNLAVSLALASLEQQCHRPQAVLACLRQGLQVHPNQPDLLLLLTETQLELGDDKGAQEVIQRLRDPNSPPGLAQFLDGRVKMSRHQWTEAIPILEEVVQSPERSAGLASRASFQLARCHEMLGDRQHRLTALQQAVAFDKSSTAARLALADALQRDGRLEKALELYRESVAMGQASEESWLMLGRALVQWNRRLPARKQRWSEVEKVLERAAHFPTLEVPIAVLRAEVLVEQERAETARSLLQKFTVDHPNAGEAWIALANLVLRQGETARSFQILKDARQQLKDHRELYQAEIAMALRQPFQEAVNTLRKLEQEQTRLPVEERLPLLRQLATAYFQLGETEEGRRICRFLTEQKPVELPSRLELLDLAIQSGDDSLLARLTQDLRRLEGENGTWWRYSEAARLLSKAQQCDSHDQQGTAPRFEAVRELVADLARRRPEWTRTALLEASLHEIDGELTKAANAYLRAFRGGERLPELAERLAGLLAEQGRLDEADEVIRQCEHQGSLSSRLARLGAEIALRLRSKERAQQLAHLAVTKETRDYQQLIWLGQVLGQAGQPSECEVALREAVKLRSDLAETWLALIAHLARIEQTREAQEVEEEMRRLLPSPQLPLALAIADEVLARWESADKHYRESLARTPDDASVLQRAAGFYVRLHRVDSAEPLLRRLLDSQANASSESQRWARRQLALLLAFSRGEDKYAEALALLPKKPENKEEPILDARIRLLVEGTRAASCRDARRFLEESAKSQPFLVEELYCLVRLCEADGDEDAAQEHMLDLLAREPKIPEYLAHHLERLLQRGRMDEARPWLKRLDELEPKSTRVQTFKRTVSRGQRSRAATADR